nr:MAG TPA: hypothetical protein [Bacteriophage sp.]
MHVCKEINKSDLNCSDSFLFFNGKTLAFL